MFQTQSKTFVDGCQNCILHVQRNISVWKTFNREYLYSELAECGIANEWEI